MTPTRIVLYQHDDDPAAYGVALADNRATVATLKSTATYASAILHAASAARLFGLPIEIEDDTPVTDEQIERFNAIIACVQDVHSRQEQPR